MRKGKIMVGTGMPEGVCGEYTTPLFIPSCPSSSTLESIYCTFAKMGLVAIEVNRRRMKQVQQGPVNAKKYLHSPSLSFVSAFHFVHIIHTFTLVLSSSLGSVR